ncbi:cell wall-binding repeat-containing protein [Herbiconiux sp. A18JL235]|uniref:Cell wall-binding repeat-containing protein n=1 Tax=Herbiconiux sp. A18JL235 TaxID=3152363 RepID=A0AB39BK13_9MICO
MAGAGAWVVASALAVTLAVPAAAASGPTAAAPMAAVPGAAVPGAAVPGAAAPAAAEVPEPTVGRISGADRYATAVEISRAAYPDGAEVAYVVTGESAPDALSAGPAAAVAGGPLLLTRSGSLPAEVADELDRLDVQRIVAVGGPASVSDGVLASLRDITAEVSRVVGPDRYATSRAVAASPVFAGGSSVAYLATGRDFPDALSAGAAAGSREAPVVLLDGLAPAVDEATRDVLTSLGAERLLVAGGPASVSPAVEESLGALAPVARLGGADRYEASAAINAEAFESSESAFLVTGAGYPDALAGSAWAGHLAAPLYAVHGDCVPRATLTALGEQGVTRVTLIGGVATLGEGVAALTPCEPAPQTAPVRVPVSCAAVLDQATAERLVGGTVEQKDGPRSVVNPLNFADDRAGALTCRWEGAASPTTSFPAAATLTIVPEVSSDDYDATANGEFFGGSPVIPGFSELSREYCRVGNTSSPTCGMVETVGGYGVRLIVTPVAAAVSDEALAATRAAFRVAVDAVAGAGAPGPLWQPEGATLAGATECDGLITESRLGEIIGDPGVREFRTFEWEYSLASFRSNAQVGGFGCSWTTGTDQYSATVLPGGAGYFPRSTPIGGGTWHPVSGYPGEAYLSDSGEQVSVLVDNAWFSVRTPSGDTASLPAFTAEVIATVRAAG